MAVADGNGGDAVVESGVNPGNTPFAGDPSATGNVLTNDTDVDTGDSKTVTAVNGSAANVGQPLVGTYGTLTLAADGSWSYALDNADPDTDALAQGADRHRRLHLHCDRRQRRHLVHDAHHHHHRHQRRAGGDRRRWTAATVTEGSLPVMTADGTIDFGDVDLTDAHVTSVTPGRQLATSGPSSLT